MSSVGFTQAFATGEFTDTAMNTLFLALKSQFAAAGFAIILDQSEAFEVLPAGHLAGTVSDDIPHWRIEMIGGSYPTMRARAIWGIDDNDKDSRTSHALYLLNADMQPEWASERAVTFAADGAAGWWWLISKQWNAANPEGIWFESIALATTTRRYAADMHPGLACRYGLFDGSDWRTPYVASEMGEPIAMAAGTLWSPLCGRVRPENSPLPRLAAPMFCEIDNSPGAHVQGEVEHLMKLTSGYTWGEAPMPGWWAFVSDFAAFALPAPASFTPL